MVLEIAAAVSIAAGALVFTMTRKNDDPGPYRVWRDSKLVYSGPSILAAKRAYYDSVRKGTVVRLLLGEKERGKRVG